MQKNLALVIGLTFVFTQAKAVFIVGYERPMQEAPLIEEDARGHEINVHLEKTLRMNRQDGSRAKVTSFTLNEEVETKCLRAPCPKLRQATLFKINLLDPTSVTNGPCGSTIYKAFEVTPHSSVRPRILTLIDHSTRTCTDYKKYTWVATVASGFHGQLFKGNPHAVYTALSATR